MWGYRVEPLQPSPGSDQVHALEYQKGPFLRRLQYYSKKSRTKAIALSQNCVSQSMYQYLATAVSFDTIMVYETDHCPRSLLDTHPHAWRGRRRRTQGSHPIAPPSVRRTDISHRDPVSTCHKARG